MLLEELQIDWKIEYLLALALGMGIGLIRLEKVWLD